MRKLFLLTVFIFCALHLHAQNAPPTAEAMEQEENAYWNKALQKIENQITTNILYDRVVSFSNLYGFNTTEHNTADKELFIQALSELHRAGKKQVFLNADQLKDRLVQRYYAKGAINTPSVDIGVINTSFNILFYDNENEDNGGLRLVNDILESIPGKPSVLTKHITLISPQQDLIITPDGKVRFELANNLLFSRNKSIKKLVANFGTSANFTLIDNGVIGSPATVNYTTFGNKKFTFTITYQDNSTLTTYATTTIEMAEAPVSGTAPNNCEKSNLINYSSRIPYKAPNESTGIHGKMEYKIFFGNNNTTGPCDLTRVKKPFIVIDGFDPGDIRRIEDIDCFKDPICRKLNTAEGETYSDENHDSIYELMTYKINPSDEESISMVEKLQAENYDVIIINLPTERSASDYSEIIHDFGADYIERNAMSLVSFIQDVNANLGLSFSVGSVKSEQLVVAGPSMGGQITRYALAYMEKKEQETGNNVWNHNTRLWVSIDSPHQGANIPLAVQGSINFFGFIYGVESAKKKYKQILRSPAAKQMLIDHYDYNWEHSVSPVFNSYQQNLKNNGLAGSNGYPTKSRNIAMTNGSLTGKTEANPGSRFIYLKGFIKIINKGVFYLKANYQQNKGVHGKVFHVRAIKNVTFIQGYSYSRTNTHWQGSLDVAPGGLFNSGNDLKNEVVDIFKKRKFVRIEMITPSTEGATVTPHSFIATHSALDTSGFSDWFQPVNKDLVCSNQTPFDTYYGEANNTEHVSFTKSAKNWLFEELKGNYQIPTGVSYEISGSGQVCNNQTETFTLTGNCSGAKVTWVVSNNLEIVSQNNQQLVVKGKQSGYRNARVKAILPDGSSTEKNLFLGTPSISVVEEGYMLKNLYIKNLRGDSVDEQGISKVKWTKISGDAFLYPNPINFLEATVTGSSDWQLNGRAKATNSCGDTEIDFSVQRTIAQDEDGNYLFIMKKGNNMYEVTDPSTNQVQVISKSELYSIYGVKLQDLPKYQNQTEIPDANNSGNYRIIKVEANGKTATKRVLVD